MKAGVALVPAAHEIPVAAELAIAAGAAQEPDTHPLTDDPPTDIGAQRVDPADDLVAGNAGIGDAGQDGVDRRRIRMAHTTSLDADPSFAGARIA